MVAPDEPVAAYVLHTRPYRETSALVDFFTLEHGKVSAVVKGLRRPGSKQRAVIQPFIPLQIRWRGRQDLKSLISAEAVGHNGILTGNALMCGLYVNELLQRLLMPFDGVPRLYVFYQYVITALVQQNDVEGALRTFERQILQETGYGLDYSQLMADQVYRFDLEDKGFVERVRSLKDRRIVNARMTESGLAMLNSAPPLLHEEFIRQFESLPKDQMQTILDSLQQVATMMHAEQLDVAPMLDIQATTPEVALVQADVLLNDQEEE
jgi:DNA repair protein RecO